MTFGDVFNTLTDREGGGGLAVFGGKVSRKKTSSAKRSSTKSTYLSGL
jgi:hypothetical protein